MEEFIATDLIEDQGKEIFVMAVEGHDGGWILYTEREWEAGAEADYEVNDGQVSFQGQPIAAVLKAKISSQISETGMQQILEAWGIHPMDLCYPPSEIWEEVADKIWDRVYTNLVPFKGDAWLTYEEMKHVFLECAKAVVEERDIDEDDMKIQTITDARQSVRNCGMSAQSGYEWPESVDYADLQERAATALFCGEYTTAEDALTGEAIKLGVPVADIC